VIVLNFIKNKKLNPVFIYEDLHLEETSKIIRKQTEGLSGVYLILNKLTLDYYIGSASTNKFAIRFRNHLINMTGSKIVKQAVIKYNLSNFSFLVLELFPEIVNKINNKDLLKLEDFYLKCLLPNYNIVTEAGNTFGYKHTDATRLKMKERIRQSASTRRRPIYSEEALLNMKKKSKPLLVFNLDGTLFGRYSSLTEATKFVNSSMKTIYRTLRTKDRILKKRWILKLDI